MMYATKPLLSFTLLSTGRSYWTVREFISAEMVGGYFKNPVVSGLYLRSDSCRNLTPSTIQIWDGADFKSNLRRFDFGRELCFDMMLKQFYTKHVKYISEQSRGFRKPILDGLWIRTESFPGKTIPNTLRVCIR